MAYNTYLINTDKFNAVKLVAEKVSKGEAMQKEEIVGRRYDSIDYFVQSYEEGSERDIECKSDLKKLSKSKQNGI